jgi:hypothetical protein
MTVTINGTSGVTFPDSSTQAVGFYGFKNRIINGGMVIDQRNAGASVSVTTDGVYGLDRFAGYRGSAVSAFTFQQSTTVPTGFTNSNLVTMGAGTPIGSGASEYAALYQKIEGYNTADLSLGSASSKAFTLSFWVRCSVTGTFGVSFRNNAADATYCSTYTISSANTFEYKTVTVPAAAVNSGTWVTNSNTGINVVWDLGVSTAYSGTAGQMNTGGNYFGVTGTTKLAATTGATFYITGVQLEKGSTATSFDYRPYGTELALCQRYFCKSFNIATAPANNLGSPYIGTALNNIQSGSYGQGIYFPVSMRSTPTMTAYNPLSATAGTWYVYTSANVSSSQTPTFNSSYITNAMFSVTIGTGAYVLAYGDWTALSEL